MKKLSALILGLLIANPAFAAKGDNEFSQILLTIAIILGIIASIYVFILSSKMGGGAIGKALSLYGFGMMSVVVSLLSVTWLKYFMGSNAGTAHDLFFIIGFILMVLGSRKVAKLFADN